MSRPDGLVPEELTHLFNDSPTIAAPTPIGDNTHKALPTVQYYEGHVCICRHALSPVLNTAPTPTAAASSRIHKRPHPALIGVTYGYFVILTPPLSPRLTPCRSFLSILPRCSATSASPSRELPSPQVLRPLLYQLSRG